MMDPILDNQRRKVGDFLRQILDSNTLFSVVSAYFTIYAYQDLRAELESIRGMRFLYGEPRGVGALDPGDQGDKAFRLTDDEGIELKRVLAQKPLARACEEWIRRKVDIRTIEQSNFLHGKLYHLARRNGDSAAILGSSNFTRRGLGLGSNPNIELNLEVCREEDRVPLKRWFDALWNNGGLTRDAKKDVLAALARLGKDYAPSFVYYKTLYHVLEERLADRTEHEGPIQDDLRDTKVWETLFSFQQDGAISAINRLMRFNGCIIADSVGLGKTFTALAVIKFFELKNKEVLVLCPKKLEQNWIRYTAAAHRANNPLADDRFRYTVLAHTDLSRTMGMAGNIDLANFNWGAFDLIVIDESHNFRNEGRDRKDEQGSLVARSRYNRLLEEVLKEGTRSKVLMLSATPVNTSLRDLRNQIYLITEKRQAAFRDSLGIGDIQTVFKLAQREFQSWEKDSAESGTRDKTALLERLGSDFLAILDAVTIARSREHVRRSYPEVVRSIGGFPTRAVPRNVYAQTDSEGQLSYDYLHERISKFRLAVYMPSRYLKDKSELEAEKRRLNFDQSDRERWLVGMMRVNLLKRLESSAHSFTLTVKRILGKMDELDRRIERWQAGQSSQEVTLLADEDEEDEEFTFGKGRKYRLEDLRLDDWRDDLRKDRPMFDEIYRRARQVGADRDAKLAKLREVLDSKINEAPPDKDGHPNRKVLVFTTFADTASYLYENLKDWARSSCNVHIGLVTGSVVNRSTVGSSRFADIVTQFAPKAQEATSDLEEIDILIATDCLSEGQNLQDCDLVVNYDIHWNPVRLMQRFGRIDRIGSRNHIVTMVNFWPTEDLDRYLDLENRVKARMALVDAAATGQDDPLAVNSVQDMERAAQYELGFRDRQLRRIRDESLDVEDVEDGVSMSDFSLDDFVSELVEYLQSRRAELEEAPFGICAVVPTDMTSATDKTKSVRSGVVFCLKHRTGGVDRTPNRLHPYFLTYVRDDGTVRYTFQQAKQILKLIRSLTAGRQEAIVDLVHAFDRETQNGNELTRYESLLAAAVRKIRGKYRRAQLQELTRNRSAKVSRQSESPYGTEAFELVTWLVIMEAT